jgi:hypothetical protein
MPKKNAVTSPAVAAGRGQSEVGSDAAECRQDQIDRDGGRRHRQAGERAQLVARRLSATLDGGVCYLQRSFTARMLIVGLL